MATEYVGDVVLELDGQEIDIESIEPTVNTGRTEVKTMNRTGRPKGFSKKMASYTLRAVIPIDVDDTVDWEGIENAKITIFPVDNEGKRTSYLDCFSTEVGESYQVDGESKRNVSFGALRKVVE